MYNLNKLNFFKNQKRRLKSDECIFALVANCINQGIEVIFEMHKLPNQANKSFEGEIKNDDNQNNLSDFEVKNNNNEKFCEINNQQFNLYNNSHYYFSINQQQQNLFQQQADEKDLIYAKSFISKFKIKIKK